MEAPTVHHATIQKEEIIEMYKRGMDNLLGSVAPRPNRLASWNLKDMAEITKIQEMDVGLLLSKLQKADVERNYSRETQKLAYALAQKLCKLEMSEFQDILRGDVSSEVCWYDSYIVEIAKAYHQEESCHRQVVSKIWTCQTCQEVQLVEVWTPDCKPSKCCKAPKFTHKAFIQRIQKPKLEVQYDMLLMTDKLLRIETLLHHSKLSDECVQLIMKHGLLSEEQLKDLNKRIPTFGKVEFKIRQLKMSQATMSRFSRNADIGKLIIAYVLPLNPIYWMKQYRLMVLNVHDNFFAPNQFTFSHRN